MNGTYGYECPECHKNCRDKKCDKFSINGKCTDGCEAGYDGEICQQGE